MAREDGRDERATGRERLLEKRIEKRESNRAFVERDEGGGLELDEDFLMGGDSFESRFGVDFSHPSSVHSDDWRENRLEARDRARERARGRREGPREERAAELLDRSREYRRKEEQTMAMLKGLAQARFGGGG
jgi:hypothetical protein